MASISGNVTIVGDPDDWIVIAWDADTHAYAGVAAVSNGTYSISGLTAGKAYVVGCRPKSGPAWSPLRAVALNDCIIPTQTSENPYIYKATEIPAIDPSYASVSLLMHFNGVNGSTTMTDSGPNAITVTAYGGAQISTTQSKFGETSLYLDGNGDYLSVASNNAIDLGYSNNNFTFEAWIYPITMPNVFNIIFDSRIPPSGNNGLLIWVNNSGELRVSCETYSNAICSGIQTNTWQHIAVTNNGGVVTAYRNGAAGATTATRSSSALSNKTAFIGQTREGGNYFHGFIDDLRLTKGVARTIATPSAELPEIPRTASSEPEWPGVVGDTVISNGVTWTNMGRMIRPMMHGPLLAI